MPRVLRAKGFIASAEGREQAWLIVEACGRTVDIERLQPAPEHSMPAPGLVFVGLDDLPAAEHSMPVPGLVFVGLDDLPAADEPAGAVRQAASRSR